ncbi:MAG: acyl-CoA dehydrogenase family protein [Omnitrophica WOR_2 bacterium]
MDFSVPEETQRMVRVVRDFIHDEVYPLEHDFLHSSFRDMLPTLAEKRARVKAMGLWCPQIPQDHGGQGLSLLEFAFVGEELGRSPLGHYLFNCQAPDAGNMEILIHYGTEEQKETYLKPLVQGEIRSCFSMTEPAYPGSNPVWMGATAIRDSGDYVLNGDKWFSTGADGAAFSIVMANTNPDAESAYQKASMIIVPTSTPGFVLVRNTSVMGETGSDYASHGEICLDNCRVPQSNLLGPEGSGFVIAQERLGPGRIYHCVRWLGICERAFDLMCAWAASRRIAPDKPLSTRQIVQAWIAESRAEIDAARLLVLQTAWKIDREGSYAARDDISLIKFFVAGILQQVLDRAIQVHGGMGMTDNLPLAYWYRNERATRIYDGPDEVHKISVARHILKEYE